MKPGGMLLMATPNPEGWAAQRLEEAVAGDTARPYFSVWAGAMAGDAGRGWI